MSDPLLDRRPRLAYPFTVLTDKGTVRLVAGEDHRYTLTAPEMDEWLPALLAEFTGRKTIAEILARLNPERREAAIGIARQLYGERVLVDGVAADTHVARSHRLVVGGSGKLRDLLEAHPSTESGSPLRLLCQDRLDYEEVLAEQRQCRREKTPFLWASYGPMTRAYVSPLFLPDAGPCFGCLLRSFQRLSPTPEIYDALREQTLRGGTIEPVDFPREGLLVLQGLILWKLRQAEVEHCDPALYRLHVLELANFEVTTHRVFADPGCAECGIHSRDSE